MTETPPDRWATRDFPVLRHVAQLVEFDNLERRFVPPVALLAGSLPSAWAPRGLANRESREAVYAGET